MGYVWIIASRYLRSKRRLSFITLVSLLASGGVFVGVAALTIVLSVMNGFEDQVQRRIAGTNAHVAVVRREHRHVGVGAGDAPLHLVLEAVHDGEDDRQRRHADEDASRGEEA